MGRIHTIIILIILGRTLAAGQGKYVFPTEVRPLLQTQWGQGYPYNKMCPWEKTDTTVRHAYAGCGPIVMSQVMRYYSYPDRSRLLSSRYDWTAMPYRKSDTMTVEQENAVARLIMDCGTAASTVYGHSASSTKLNDVVGGLKKHFGYNRYMHIVDRAYYRGKEGDRAWKSLIYAELKAGRPVIMRGERNRHTAHVFIIDGCRDSTVHVNWGWDGARDGYYDPDTLYGYRANQRMVVDIAPQGYVPEIREIRVDRPGQLSRQITAADWLGLHHVRITGTVNSEDVRLLRRLAGGGKAKERKGNLSSIDMSRSVILTLPDSAFCGCDNLTFMSLPITLPEISRYAFSGCTKLNYIRIQPMVGEIKRRAFAGCFNLLSVSLPPSLTVIGPNAFNSCNSLTEVSLPPTVTTIGQLAFAYSRNLRSLTVPRSASKISGNITKGTSVTKIRRL